MLGHQLPNVTDTKLRNLQTLWLHKYQAWGVNLAAADTDAKKQCWLSLIETSISREFNLDEKGQIGKLLMETIKNGLFFELLDLNLTILKRRLRQ